VAGSRLDHHPAQGGQQPRVHLRRDVVVGVRGQEAAKLRGEFGLAAATPADVEVLLDRGALGRVGDAVEVLPQLADRLRATNHRIGSLSSPCVCGTSTRTLILHWNGSAWTRVPSPNPALDSSLTGVAAASADSAWAIGDTISDNSNSPLTLRWNGTAWTTVPAGLGPDASIEGVAAAPAGTAWAVGNTGIGTSGRTLILRWNGTAWTRVPSPGPGVGLVGVAALSDSDAWAVGTAGGKVLILRWNGKTWSVAAGQPPPAAAPTSPSAVPSAVSSLAPSAVSSPEPAVVSSPAVPTRRQAAQALAALLAQSGADRTAITQAFNAVAACSPGLSQDETVFANAASSHQALLGKLAALPGRSARPAAMLSDLTAAWQASAEADQDFAGWTHDEISHGCRPNDQSDASYQAATAPDTQATTDKKAVTAQWTAIAEEYGLPVYQYNQI
jgi:hypothetical protein